MMVKCDFCNNDIKKVPSHVTEHNFCNYKCSGNWRRGRKRPEMAGENNPFFGKHHSEETITKLKYKKTEDHKEKIRQKAIGKHQSDITRKKRSESQMGDKNHAYIHGDSRRKYCYKFLGKNGVRERSLLFFNNRCIECNKTKEEKNDEYLTVHHVYYRKMSCCENNEEYENGVKKIGNILYIREGDQEFIHEIQGPQEKFAVLCHSCHAKTTTHNRLFWIQYFEEKINKLYNGNSYIPKNKFNDDIYLNTDNQNNNIKED